LEAQEALQELSDFRKLGEAQVKQLVTAAALQVRQVASQF
jgi:hypothetical protein